MSWGLHFWASLLSAAILTSACHHAFAQTRTENVIQFKLEEYGWQPPPKQQRGEWPGEWSRLVSIDHKGRVLVGFTARENYGLATREHPGLSFHILRFTAEGKVDLSLILPTNSWFTNGFYVGPDDRIFARANDVLQLEMENGQTNNSPAAWRPLAPCPKTCYISQSSSRRTLVLREFEGPDRYTYTVLDASSFPPRLVQRCPWIGFYGELVTDRFAYQSTDGISTDARRWPLCDQEHETELPLDMRNGMISPLSDEALLLLGTGKDGSRRGIDLVSPDGQLRFHREMPKHDFVGGPVRSDERGDRFVFIVETWRGGSRLLDISGSRVARRVVVYSETGHQLSTVSVNPVYHRDFDFAMSPDGHRLAILDQGVVTVADLE